MKSRSKWLFRQSFPLVQVDGYVAFDFYCEAPKGGRWLIEKDLIMYPTSTEAWSVTLYISCSQSVTLSLV